MCGSLGQAGYTPDAKPKMSVSITKLQSNVTHVIQIPIIQQGT